MSRTKDDSEASDDKARCLGGCTTEQAGHSVVPSLLSLRRCGKANNLLSLYSEYTTHLHHLPKSCQPTVPPLTVQQVQARDLAHKQGGSQTTMQRTPARPPQAPRGMQQTEQRENRE